MKKNKIALVLALLLLLTAFSGCKPKEITMESLLPRTNIIKASVAYLNIGLGENIPSLSYETIASECGELCDVLYAATPVLLDLEGNTYSPELNATHEIGLTTSAGTLKLFFDDYQNLISVPTLKGMEEGNVRIYKTFQITGLSELLAAWQSNLPIIEPEPPVEELPPPEEEQPAEPAFVAPDDSALREIIDATLLSQTGEEVVFETIDLNRSDAQDVFYAFSHNEIESLPDSKVLLVAAAAQGTGLRYAVSRVEINDTYVKVLVSRAAASEDGTSGAAMVERTLIDIGKPIVFMDDTGSVLYVQILNIPGEATETVDPNAELEEETGEAPAEPPAE